MLYIFLFRLDHLSKAFVFVPQVRRQNGNVILQGPSVMVPLSELSVDNAANCRHHGSTVRQSDN